VLERVKGIIIKTQAYGETHKIITIFSQKLGKFSAIARGANKPKSKMAAVTQPYIYADFLVYVRSGLSTIQQGEIIHSFRAIREDIIKASYAAYIMELTNKLMEQKSPHLFLFNQLFETMKRIETSEEIEIPVMMYELKLYQYSGFAPIVDRCVFCGRRDSLCSFSIREGGLLCDECVKHDQQAISLPKNIVKLLHIFLKIKLQRIRNISIQQSNKNLLRQILNEYYDTYGGYFIKSRNVLRQLDLLQ